MKKPLLFMMIAAVVWLTALPSSALTLDHIHECEFSNCVVAVNRETKQAEFALFTTYDNLDLFEKALDDAWGFVKQTNVHENEVDAEVCCIPNPPTTLYRERQREERSFLALVHLPR